MTIGTSYQGVKVVDVDTEVPCRHPRYGYDKLSRLKGATLLGLEDDVFVVICNDCNYNGISGHEPYVKPEGEPLQIIKQSDRVLAHRNGTHNLKAPRAPMYSDEMIKVAIKVYLKWKGTKVKNWATAAAEELERTGFKPYRSDKWTGSILSSLANHYMKVDRFKNVRAAPLDDNDRAYLAKMIHDAVDRETGHTGGRPTVAGSVRITETKKHTNAPAESEQTVSEQEAGEPQENEDEVEVTSDMPTLNFAGKDSDPTPTRTLDVRAAAEIIRKAPASVVVQPSVLVADSDFEFITELEGGTLLFKHKGTLMAGKPVKGIEF